MTISPDLAWYALVTSRFLRYERAPHESTPGRRNRGRLLFVDIEEVARVAGALAGVRCTAPGGWPEWRYHGRLVARQLDEVHLVIRADFDYRASVLRQLPGTFSVPARYLKHMMVVADLANGDAGAIEDAIEAAWLIQQSAD